MTDHFNMQHLIDAEVKIDLLAKKKLNTLYVGKAVYAGIKNNDGKMYGTQLYLAGIKVVLNEMLKPTDIITFDHNLMEMLKELEANEK